MKNLNLFNVVNSSKLMDQVFKKYEIYTKTYFGQLSQELEYDFTTSIDAYVNAPVRSGNWTTEGIYKYSEDTTATLDTTYGLSLNVDDSMKRGICISHTAKVIEFSIYPTEQGRFQINGFVKNDLVTNPLYMDFNKGTLTIAIRQKDGTKKSFTSTYNAKSVLDYKIECKGNSIRINDKEYTCDDMMTMNSLTQMSFVASKVSITGYRQCIKYLKMQ